MYYKYDLKNGIIYDCAKFLIPILITIIACISFNSIITSAEINEMLDRNADFADLLLYIFKGEKTFNPLEDEEFHFPFMWLIIQLSVAFIVGKYPFSEIYDNYGSVILIKGKSRKKWIISKFLWIVTVCVLFYLLIIITAIIFSLIFGFSFNLKVFPSQSFVYLTSINYLDSRILIKLFLLPLVTSIALSFFQTAISLLFQPVYGFICILIICGTSIFTDSIYAFGRYSLLIRYEYFNISIKTAILTLSIISIFSFLFCLVYFEKCDILHNRRNE